MSFTFQYLGSTSVTRTHGTGSTDEAVKTIVQDVSLLCHLLVHVVGLTTDVGS